MLIGENGLVRLVPGRLGVKIDKLLASDKWQEGVQLYNDTNYLKEQLLFRVGGPVHAS